MIGLFLGITYGDDDDDSPASSGSGDISGGVFRRRELSLRVADDGLYSRRSSDHHARRRGGVHTRGGRLQVEEVRAEVSEGQRVPSELLQVHSPGLPGQEEGRTVTRWPRHRDRLQMPAQSQTPFLQSQQATWKGRWGRRRA